MGDEPGENDLKNARDMIEYLEEELKRGKDIGIDFSEAEGVLQGSRMMLDTGAMLDAQELINQCAEMVSQRFTDFELLQTNIEKLEMNIQNNPVADISGDAEKNLKMAKYHNKTGYYRLGNDYAARGLKIFSKNEGN